MGIETPPTTPRSVLSYMSPSRHLSPSRISILSIIVGCLMIALHIVGAGIFIRLYHDCLPYAGGHWLPYMGSYSGPADAFPKPTWVPPPNFRLIGLQILDANLNVFAGTWLLVLGCRHRRDDAAGNRRHVIWSWATLGLAAAGFVLLLWMLNDQPASGGSVHVNSVGTITALVFVAIGLHPILLIPYPFALLCYFYADPKPDEPCRPSS